MSKIVALQKWLKSQGLDIAFINNPDNIAYLCGYHSDPHERVLALVIASNGMQFLFAPALEVAEAKAVVTMPVFGYEDQENPWELIKMQILELFPTMKNWAIEKETLSVARLEALQTEFKQATFTTDITQEFQRMRLIKSQDEIVKMIDAGKLADIAFEIGFAALKEGITEAEVVAEIEFALKKQGVRQMSFDTLVLTGAHAASPHGTPGGQQVQRGDLVLFDLGVVWNGYTSDATRTVAFESVSSRQEEIYQLVLAAQEAAQAAVKPGITAGELDKIARDIISRAGYGEYFIHRLGHGLGSSVHEYPSIMAGNDLVIEEGMCFSLEPGIYIPGEIGVRIEDCVYVTATGCEALTKTPKELQIIK